MGLSMRNVRGEPAPRQHDQVTSWSTPKIRRTEASSAMANATASPSSPREVELSELQCHFADEAREREQSFRRRRYCLGELCAEPIELFGGVFFLEKARAIGGPLRSAGAVNRRPPP
jgi:hypothetical protein